MYFSTAYSFCVFLFCCAPLTAAQGRSVTVFIHFQDGVSEVALHEMEVEAESLLAPAGIGLGWRFLNDAAGYSSASELIVAKFHGTCEVDTALQPLEGGGALGWTHTTDGEVLPFTTVECERLRRFLNPFVRTEKFEVREALLGRAMARVLAHELYHILNNTSKHAGAGIAKPYYTPLELISETAGFQANDWKGSSVSARVNSPAEPADN